MNRSTHTFCPGCGKMVNLAPGFCILCGVGLANSQTPEIEPAKWRLPFSIGQFRISYIPSFQRDTLTPA